MADSVRRRVSWVVVIASLWLAACSPPEPVSRQTTGNLSESTELAQMLTAKGVAPEEADRLAALAFATSEDLARAYRVSDPPLVHNTKVNLGLRERGLCYHWADDLEARLRQEDFRSVRFHRAIANADNPFRIEHSTVIVSRHGGTMEDGVVLDPWRNGGALFWAPVRDDSNYDWEPRAEVQQRNRERQQATEQAF